MIPVSHWVMRFNPSKCNTIRIHRGNSLVSKLYELCGTVLLEVHHAKYLEYLGVTISNDLGWSSYVDNITKKSSNILNFLRRKLKYRLKQPKGSHFAKVRSTLEFTLSTAVQYGNPIFKRKGY